PRAGAKREPAVHARVLYRQRSWRWATRGRIPAADGGVAVGARHGGREAGGRPKGWACAQMLGRGSSAVVGCTQYWVLETCDRAGQRQSYASIIANRSYRF